MHVKQNHKYLQIGICGYLNKLYICSIMRVNKIHNIKNIYTLLFILITGGIIINSTLFLHTHRTVYGKVIFHAHPFNKSAENNNPLQKHQHNKIDLQLLSSIEYFFANQFDIFIQNNLTVERDLFNLQYIFVCSNYHNELTSRGPPFICFSV